MHMANEQYQQNSHKWETWELGFQTLERFFQPGRLLEWRVFIFIFYFYCYLFIYFYFIFIFIFFIYLFIYFFFFFWGGGAQLQCIY